MIISLILPLPPSKNKRAGKRFIPSEFKEYDKLVAKEVLIARSELIPKFDRFEKKKEIVLKCDWYINNHRSDIANYHDALCDALQKALEVNDKYFRIIDNSWNYDKEEPRLVIQISQG